MASDVLALFQTFSPSQTSTQKSKSTSSSNNDGKFDRLMNGCMSKQKRTVSKEPSHAVNDDDQPSYKDNKSLAKSVIDILAGGSESEEAQTESLEDVVIWPGEVSEDADSLTEELMDELIKADDTADTLKNEEVSDTKPSNEALAALADSIADEDDEPDDDDEVSQTATELAGLEGVGINDPRAQQAASRQNSQPSVDASSRRNQASSARTGSQPQEQQKTSATQEGLQNFREAIDGRTAENAEPQNDGQGQNQNQSFTQERGDSGTRDSSSRSRNDSRRVDARTQTEDTESQNATRRTDSHSNFQSYFDGVLSSRRTSSTSSPMPLSLRSTENFTQASLLRDGLTNVVRFIRADGVQKARVIVDPPALGRISVELTSGTSGVEASIKVASEQIRQLVQDQLSQLRMNLSQQGVQVAEFTVDVQQDNSGNQSQQGQDQGGQYANYFVDDDDDEVEEFRVDLEDGLLFWVA